MDFPPVPLPIDGVSLLSPSATQIRKGSPLTPREVTTLQHELGDDTVERASFVSESILASCELTEVLGGFWDNAVVELENDAASGLAVDGDIKLATQDTDRKIGMSEACTRSFSEAVVRTKTLAIWCQLDGKEVGDREI